jgi:4-amino-4-deoxy-L-arabinose transferase-like glycosyltransferase
LLAITCGALLVRLGYVFVYRRHAQPSGDAFFYHFQANLLASGRGFINPDAFYFLHKAVPAADHPPMWTVVLAVAALVGLKSFFSQILWSCVVGAMGVALVGLAAKEAAGPTAGLGAAVIAALYPVFWINDGALMSESLVLGATAFVIWCFYRLWHRPSLPRALWLGVACGLAALTRSELVLLVPILAVGVGVGHLAVGARRRVGLTIATLFGALLAFAPWWVYNIPRFSDPVLLSSQLGVTLEGANCPATYSGPLIGSWSLSCNLSLHPTPGADPSQQDDEYREAALHYAEQHESRLPLVVTARLGRELGLYSPIEQIDLEWAELGRPRLPATIGLFVYYLTAVVAVGGVVVLRRRKVPVLPLVAVAADVLVAAVATFGETRYRTSLDVVLIVLAGVAVAELVQGRRFGPSGRTVR